MGFVAIAMQDLLCSSLPCSNRRVLVFGRNEMTMKSMIVLGLAAVITQSSVSAAQVIAVTTPPEVIGIDGADLFQARKVLRRFFANERHPECYRVLFSRRIGNLTVDFVQRQDRVVVVQEGTPEPAIERRCGREIGYELDRQGNVLREIHVRY
jgi:hypothetical protein